MLQTVWGWQPALYLFLGGLGSGAFVTAAILRFYRKDANRLIICVSMWAAVVSLVVGLILLLTDLVEPLRGMMMWRSFIHPSSWMVWGAWGLFCALIVFGLSAVLTTLQIVNPPWKFLQGKGEKSGKSESGASVAVVRPLPERLEKPITVLSAIGIPFGLFVGFYTGCLLMAAPGIPFWNTIALPFLFLVSAVDTGVALVEFIAVILTHKDALDADSHRLILKFTVINVIIEMGLMATFLSVVGTENQGTAVGAAAHDSVMMLVGGSLAPLFWTIIIGIGLVLPFILNLVTIIVAHGKSKQGKKDSPQAKPALAVALVSSLGVLVGGCTLRFLVLAAGMHPEIVMEAFKNLIQ